MLLGLCSLVVPEHNALNALGKLHKDQLFKYVYMDRELYRHRDAELGEVLQL